MKAALVINAFLASVLVTGCRSHDRVADHTVPSPAVNSAAEDAHASYVTEINFAKGSSTLTPAAKDRLDNVVSRARQSGTIDDIKVISWADQRYPGKDMKALSKPQRDLASRRNHTLNDYIKQQTTASVDTYNMAERPNSLEKLFSTSDARIKRSLEDSGVTSNATDMRFPRNASKALVMLILKK